MKRIILFITGLLIIQACRNNETTGTDTTNADTTHKPSLKIPDFNSDSAYNYVAAQVAFGPRVPSTPAQTKCADWMLKELKMYCDTVYVQKVQVKGGDGKMLPCINLIGVINPKAQRRLLLLTHWDSRPWADQDTHDQDKPILAADDGGSGVAVLIEVARQIKNALLNDNTGVDILLEDVEDYGKTEWGEDSYCLGTQYWAHNPHVTNYHADFGILLDMVGARYATFPYEATSSQYAGDVQQKVWNAASVAGYSSYFPPVAAAAITDDHVSVNQITHIPTIDIINLITNGGQQVFASHWHTHNDNMSIIDKNTLKAVGQTLLEVIYEHTMAN